MPDRERWRQRIGEANIKEPELGVVIFSPSPTCVFEGERTRPQVSKARDGRIDSVKFWLVVLVVTAHVMMRKEFAGSVVCAALWNWLCVFAMPLFVFISGSYSRKKDWRAFWSSIWKLVEPLIIFQVIGLAFYVSDPISLRTVLTPWYMLWYLLSLIYWRLMLQVIPEGILKYTKLVLITMFCVCILAGFLPFDRFLTLQRTLALMPFFFLGYYMKGRNLYLPDKYKPFCVAFLIVIFTILLFYPHRINDLKFASPYTNILGATIRMLVFGLSVPMSVAFINVCPHTRWTARQGTMSLQYYIYHALLVPPNSALIMPPLIVIAEKLAPPMTIVTAAIIIIAVTVGLSIVLRIPYIKSLTNPSSLCRNLN